MEGGSQSEMIQQIENWVERDEWRGQGRVVISCMKSKAVMALSS